MKDLAKEVRKIIRENMWLVLSTVDDECQPHSSVVMYQSDGHDIYFETGDDTLKARNIRNNNKISVTIPFRKNFIHKIIPAPPAELHFKAKAELISKNNEKARKIMERVIKYEEKAGIENETIWIKIMPSNIISTFGVGTKLLDMRKPEKARNLINLDYYSSFKKN
ncbi:MAG: pyridoxamine 5'-phosphate oxidase family protein [Promethearchaeota archaeon]|nr:MAG: pyridoxamine 5'-phosphate oxidase family protein [Candidatus Lokiarchaeota archaeon]